MIRRSVLFLVLAGFMIFLLTACSDSDDPVNPGVVVPGTIKGRVMNTAYNEPLAGVTIYIMSKPYAANVNDFVTTTITDADGFFIRTDIPAGEIFVGASLEGFVTPEDQTWALSPDGSGDFQFDMAPGEDPLGEFEGDEQVAWPPGYQH